MADNSFEIRPELMILTNETKAKSKTDFSYRLDSGEDDYNRVIASNDLDTLNFFDINITGFDKYLYFDDMAQLASFVAKIKQNLEEPENYLKEKKGKNVVIAVFGKISITLANDSASEVELCRPVYRIPLGKRGELYSIQDVRQDISKTWIEECKEALFYSGSDAVKRFGVVKRLKDSDQLQLKMLKVFFGVALLVITILGVGGVFNGRIGANAANQSYNPPLAAPSQATAAQTLMEANNPQPVAYSDNPASVVYGGGFTGQAGHNTVDDFARIEVEQRDAMLKQMGVDVSSPKQSLGCFAGSNT